MLRSTVRNILGIAFAALGAWAADRIVDKLFGPDQAEPRSA